MAVGSANLLVSGVGIESVLDLVPFEGLVSAVLGQLELRRSPLAVVSLLPDNDDSLPVPMNSVNLWFRYFTSTNTYQPWPKILVGLKLQV